MYEKGRIQTDEQGQGGEKLRYEKRKSIERKQKNVPVTVEKTSC